MIWLDMKTSYRVTHRVCQGKELLEDQQRRTDQLEAQLAHLQDWADWAWDATCLQLTLFT